MHISIIGGGIIGLFSAYYLQQEGYDITLFDKESDVLSASYGNAGMICPSHFIPLAAPGIIQQGFKWMLDSKSPLLFRPSFDLDFIQWCLSFYQHASKRNVINHIGLMNGLLNYSKKLYLSVELQGVIPPLDKHGILMFCNTQHALDEEIELSHKAARLGIETKTLSNDDIQSVNPGVRMIGMGAVHYTGDITTDPIYLMNELKNYLFNRKVKLVSEEVTGFIKAKNSITRIKTNENEIPTDAVLVCTGAESTPLTTLLGEKILIQSGKGYNITIENKEPSLRTAMILVESRVALTPMGTKLRIGGTMEIGNLKNKVNQSRIEGVLSSTEKYLPEYKRNELSQYKPWYGSRPLSVDGMPVVKKINNCENAFINAGHGMLGLSLAPACGELITQIISNTLSAG